MSDTIQNSTTTKSVIRYSIKQLLALRDSPLCQKPENFMTLEDWKNEGLVSKNYPRPRSYHSGSPFNPDSNIDDSNNLSIEENDLSVSPSLLPNATPQHKSNNPDFKSEKRIPDVKLRPHDFNFFSSKQGSIEDNVETSHKFNNDLKFKKSNRGPTTQYNQNFKNTTFNKSTRPETGTHFNSSNDRHALSNDRSNELDEPVPEWANYTGKSTGLSHQQMSQDFQAWKAQMKEKTRLENMKNSAEVKNSPPRNPPPAQSKPSVVQEPTGNSTISPAFQNFLNQYAAAQTTDLQQPQELVNNNAVDPSFKPAPISPNRTLPANVPNLSVSQFNGSANQPPLPPKDLSNKHEIENQLKNLLNIGSSPTVSSPNPPKYTSQVPSSRPIQLPSGFMPTSVLKKLNSRNQPSSNPSNFQHLSSFIDQKDRERHHQHPAGFGHSQHTGMGGYNASPKIPLGSPSFANTSPGSMPNYPYLKPSPVANNSSANRPPNQMNSGPQYAGFQGFSQDTHQAGQSMNTANKPNKNSLLPVFSNQQTNSQALLNSFTAPHYPTDGNQYPSSAHPPSHTYKTHQ